MVGLVSIGALIGLAFLLMSFGELDPLFNPRYAVTIRTDHAAGLRSGGAIEFNGVPVGVIDSVYTQPDPQFPVRIIALLEPAVDIPGNVVMTALQPLIGGSSRLQFQLPTAPSGAPLDPAPPLSKDGSAALTGRIGGGVLEQINNLLDQRMQPLIEALDAFKEFSRTYTSLGENLNTLFAPQSQAEIEAGREPNLHTAVVRLNEVLDHARASLELARDFLGDEQVRANARASVEKAHLLIERATDAVERYARLADSLNQNSSELAKRLIPLSDQLGATLEEVRRVARLASEGEGTVGQLLNNPELYDSLNDAAVRLERALVEVQLLVEKLKQEGVNIGF